MNTGRITANLPSRNFDETERFYARLGFTTDYRGADWMILSRDGMQIEFFPHPELVPSESWFSACMRLGEIDRLHAEWAALGMEESCEGFPRMLAPFTLEDAPRMFTLHDPDGSLWRIIETGDTA